MAKITIKAALGDLGTLGSIVDGSHLHVVTNDGTTLTLADNEGDGFTFTGTGLTYAGNFITSGTFTGLTVFKTGGATLETVTNFSFDAPTMQQTIGFSGLEAAVLQLLSNNDNVIGSSKSDLLVGAGGNDIIHGGGGADIIGGSVGRDKLYGEAGADTFIYVKGDGRDHIMDFTDTNGAGDDQIGITLKMYRSMVIEETLTGVTLHFGANGSIDVDNWHAADIGKSDFVFG